MPSKKMLDPSHSTRLNTVFKRFAARTCGTLMLTKQTGGNVMLYGPILMESSPPGNKGLLSPDAARIWFILGKVLLKVTAAPLSVFFFLYL